MGMGMYIAYNSCYEQKLKKNFDMCEVEKIGHNTCYTLNRK